MSLVIKKICTKLRLFIKKSTLVLIDRMLFRLNKKKTPETILLFRTCLLGDFLFAVPALNIVRKKFPASKLILLTSFAGDKTTLKGGMKYLESDASFPPWFNFVFPSIIDEIVIINEISFLELSIIKKKIKRLKPDYSFILSHPGDAFSGLLKKLLLLKFVGIKQNVFGYRVNGDYGFDREYQFSKGYFKHKVYGPIDALKECKQFHDIDEYEIAFPLQISEKGKAFSSKIFNKISKQNKVICVAFGSIQPHKRWPLSNYKKLLVELHKLLPRLTIILVGTKGDIEISKNLTLDPQLSNLEMLDLTGKTSVDELAAVLCNSQLLIGNDGGAIQLGAAVKCKTVSILSGIEYPNSVDPWGNEANSVRHSVPCSPCYSMKFCPLGHNLCLVDLSVKIVLNKIKEILEIND